MARSTDAVEATPSLVELGRLMNQAARHITHIRQSESAYARPIGGLPNGQGAFNVLYRRYRKGGRRRLPFTLTKEDFSFLTRMNCFYCGAEPNQIRRSRYLTEDYPHNGLDRIDNTKGYTLDNVVPCCKVCNFMKKAYSLSFFLSHVSKIAEHRRLDHV